MTSCEWLQANVRNLLKRKVRKAKKREDKHRSLLCWFAAPKESAQNLLLCHFLYQWALDCDRSLIGHVFVEKAQTHPPPPNSMLLALSLSLSLSGSLALSFFFFWFSLSLSLFISLSLSLSLPVSLPLPRSALALPSQSLLWSCCSSPCLKNL